MGGEVHESLACRKKRLPVGIENFEEIRTRDYYYVDKTGLISDLINSGGKVTLFTRPRRFGKTLNISMLEAFFSPDSDKRIFDGLKVSEETALCGKYMGKYPVISLSLKGVQAGNFGTAREMALLLIRDEVNRYADVLLQSTKLSEIDKEDYKQLLDINMSEAVLYKSLKTLSGLLKKHYETNVIVLIDEYDVPLAKAYDQGYYDQMIILIRNIFENVLKTNDSLETAILTGCMRISKESIFTGLNNLRVLGVADDIADEYFGFTDAEVRDLLAYYGLAGRHEEVREWYDGYRFGNVDVYCPWDVINYCDKARFSKTCFPENYWMGSSGNQVIRRLVESSGNALVKSEVEALINGEAVEKTVHQELTYEDMYVSIDNIWSVLFTTGYLTQRERVNSTRFRLVIPNREVRDIFAEQILELFREETAKDGQALTRICNALQDGNASAVEKVLNEYLRRTISIRDTAVRKTLKENFYHGILLGILSVKADWAVSSNEESGDGYSDVIVRFNNYETAMIIELKYADEGDMDAVCRMALQQIDKKNYDQRLCEEGFEHILKYGIAFYMKKSRVMLREENRLPERLH